MTKPKLFIIILKYLVELENIDKYRSAHLEYLNKHYEDGTFLASGRQVPAFGGIILAKANNRRALYEILAQDPFHQQLCAEYQVHEFAANKGTASFEKFLQEADLSYINPN